MSVSAAAVKTMPAQKPRTGVGDSRSQTKKGIATIRPMVSRLGRLTASSASDRRRFCLSMVLGVAILRPSAHAHEDGALAGEAHEPALAAGRFGRGKRANGEPPEPADDPFPAHEQRPSLDARH